MLQKIDRFGVKALLSRDILYYGEVNRMIYAENITVAYHSRRRSDNWAAWVVSNPDMARYLIDVEKQIGVTE